MSFLRLFGRLSLDGSGFDSTLAKAENQGRGFTSRMGSHFAGLGKTLLTAFTGTAILNGMRRLASEADRILNLVDELAVSPETIQRVGQAFQRAGLGKDAANESLRGLLRQLRTAKGGSQTAIDALTTLGVQGILMRPDMTVEEALSDIVAQIKRQRGKMTQAQREASQQVFLSRATPGLMELATGRFRTASAKNLREVDRFGDEFVGMRQEAGAGFLNFFGGFLRLLDRSGNAGSTGAPGFRAMEEAVYRGSKRAQQDMSDRP